MLKRKLEDGTVVGLSIESVQGGVLVTLDNNPPENDTPKFSQSFMLNPVEVMELWHGLGKQFCRITEASGRKLEFRAPHPWEHEPIYLEISEDKDDYIRFPMREYEVEFIRKTLLNFGISVLFVGTWSGEPEEL